MTTQHLAPQLKRLRLSGVLDSLDVRTQQAIAEHWSYGEFLTRLIQDEVERGKFWDYYRALLAYRENPRPEERERLAAQFDTLFATQTGYWGLDEQIAKTRAKGTSLLSCDHEQAVIVSGSRFQADWLKQRVDPLIGKVLRTVLGFDVEREYRVLSEVIPAESK